MRTSEIIVPLDMDEVWQVHCEAMDTTSGIMTSNGAYNVLMVLQTTDPCKGPHVIRRIAL